MFSDTPTRTVAVYHDIELINDKAASLYRESHETRNFGSRSKIHVRE